MSPICICKGQTKGQGLGRSHSKKKTSPPIPMTNDGLSLRSFPPPKCSKGSVSTPPKEVFQAFTSSPLGAFSSVSYCHNISHLAHLGLKLCQICQRRYVVHLNQNLKSPPSTQKVCLLSNCVIPFAGLSFPQANQDIFDVNLESYLSAFFDPKHTCLDSLRKPKIPGLAISLSASLRGSLLHILCSF